ncbi:thiamine pyrophosphate-binding protein [Brevibacterium antiquum]|uniref:thiamine pyrophosphate-dependent enzyme n=1 Tax=Brevibacterium antiquum TaxID=234835 RepID=UPI0018DF85F2|nr:thiamine pyrophosphate-dependent enzyme [Brevibacterium antiquum]
MSEVTAGHAVVRTLAAHGINTVFSVPGESFLEVLDGLCDSSINNVVCRHEGGASYAAEATGKLGTLPGIAMVTRGPGAANAMVGIHAAYQDATAMILFIGLIPIADRGRESFQEFDIQAWFGSTTKAVFVLEEAKQASAIVAKAISISQSGRPGPVVVGLPEDVLRDPAGESISPPIPAALDSLADDVITELSARLNDAERPLFVLGGSSWTQMGCQELRSWLEMHNIPAAVEWRGEGLIDSDSSSYVGSLGYGRSDSVARALDQADLVVVVGTVLGDVNTDGYTLRQDPAQTTVVINADRELLGHGAAVSAHVPLNPSTFVECLDRLNVTLSNARSSWFMSLRQAYLDDAVRTPPPSRVGRVSMTRAMTALSTELNDNAGVKKIALALGAGNHTAWAAPFFDTHHYGSLLSVRNGSMGYSIPAALAVGLADPECQAVAICGDGEFMMNANELATVAQQGLSPLIIVMDNGQFGTIRSHQEQWHPGRVSGTQIVNPRFTRYVEAVNGLGFEVNDDDQLSEVIPVAVDYVARNRGPVLIHLIVDSDVLLP